MELILIMLVEAEVVQDIQVEENLLVDLVVVVMVDHTVVI
jgi:hypothetical protein